MKDKASIVKDMGFVICVFLPNQDNTCDHCDEPNRQLYFQGPDDVGMYWCYPCIRSMYYEGKDSLKKIKALETEGHTSHCAARQVYGDGQCECPKKGVQ